jgi:hypothetical protein
MPKSWKSVLQPAQLWKLLKDTFGAWSHDKVPRHGAALAYYTVLSLVPLLVVIIAMIGLIFGRDAAQGYILDQMGSLVGPQSAEGIKEMIQRASQPSTGVVATLIATVTLLAGASGVFAAAGFPELGMGRRTERRPRHLGRNPRSLHLSGGAAGDRLFTPGVAGVDRGGLGRRHLVWRLAACTGVRATDTRAAPLASCDHGLVRPDV